MTKWRALALAVCFAATAAPAWAQQPTQAQSNAIRQACRADYQAHCASVPTGGSASLACLQQNAASLSPGCQSALAAIGSSTATAPASPPHA
ncbi:MAG: cysteine rich repeat-containing protein, partial [Acetobacteraceae bacterium]